MGFIFNRGGIISPLIRTLAIALFMLTMVECVTRKAGRNSADKELRVRRAECDKDACDDEIDKPHRSALTIPVSQISSNFSINFAKLFAPIC